jgi:uncharacterized membrane protein SpoIIM required for sporulation
MLESLWFKEEMENKHLQCFLFAAGFTAISIFLTYFFLPFYEGLICVFMTSLAAAYPVTRYLREHEEEELIKNLSEKSLLARHARELEIYLTFFHGVLFVFLLAGLFMPKEFFSLQLQTIKDITGAFGNSLLLEIITHNLWVFALTFLLTFFITAGIIFILVWNASVLGVFLAETATSVWHVPLLALAYLPHGLVEISSYMLAGIAGALLSHQSEHFWLEKSYGRRHFGRVWRDVVILLLIGLFALALAALIEVYL